ncbi:acetyl-CoA carboxylase biotin carboxylase subunit [Nocardia wallacei]|uniref:acetyl-CoA carboxylase biotin carboxylase subunit n=1 Tax=Nocardia wallacei TaxID=480035 RepID=UPI002457417D|nr:acetyl-CoA carboxylase biotin carboxylase subunit [Nocardia wallacei]
MFDKILIANRGEIAVRVARTCRELGVPTVAVHSEADRESLAVRLADEAVCIGPAASKRSYLDAAAVLTAARITGADAIHPGYGFLSESPDFADACRAAGVTLIGPPADVMAELGDKQSARTLMAKAGLPLLPGSLDALDADEAHALAEEIGFPVIVKAAAGGGGRGMQIVRDSAEFPRAYRETRATARMLFGDSRVYVEKYLERARHVEIQVLCDGHGAGIHLGERDCSVQRRHQKLVEESPAPRMPDGLAERMGRAAVQGVLAAGYVGAGTVEFLVDQAGNYYFMEVNCRIQVEHPVTEMVTGIDLVAEQIRIAAGLRLGRTQDQVVSRGAAIECRINAEDPAAGFAPTPARIGMFVPPGGPFVRVDTHAHSGYSIPPHYDSLLAKVIVWAPDRDGAIARMRRALGEFDIDGERLRTTREFLLSVLDHADFRSGNHSTALVADL